VKTIIEIYDSNPKYKKYVCYIINELTGSSKHAGSVSVDWNDEVVDLYVTIKFRRKGIARILMEKVIKDNNNRDLTLFVEPDDDDWDSDEVTTKYRLRKFYKSLGFKQTKGDFMTRHPS